MPLTIKEKILGVDHPDTALTANNLGVILQSQKRFAEARSLFARALAVFQPQLGSDHPKTIMARENLAATEQNLRKPPVKSKV